MSCSSGPREAPAAPIPDPHAVLPDVSVDRGQPNATVDALLGSLSVDQKIGQLVMPWLIGSYSAADGEGLERTLAAIDSFEIGGIIISVGTPMDVAAKLNTLQRRSHLPLLVAADLEWGTGMRLDGGTAFPMPMAVGATGRATDAYEMGRITALEARAVGIHLTFSPVADVNNNPANPIINTRSFGEDPHEVSRLIEAYIEGAEQHGLRTTAKHFPGHGDTGTDSHITVPVAPGCWNRLDTLELLPFRAAITAGVTAVMTAHIALPCLEGSDPLPATLSPSIMTGVLRDSLGFDGLIVTDALVMGAIVERFGAGETAVRAFRAGSDVLLMPANIGEAVQAMRAAIADGRITEERLNQSVARLLRLKRDLGLLTRRTVDLDRVPFVVGRRAFQDAANDIAQRALTLVRRGPIDAFRAEDRPLAVISYAEETNLTFGNRLVSELRRLGGSVTPFRLYPASGSLSYDSARAIVGRAERIVFASSVRPIAGRGHVALPDSLAAVIEAASHDAPTMLVSLGSPYLLTQIPDFAGGYLIGWSANAATERAVARALAGQAPITGRLPITLSPAHPRGSGIRIVD